MNEKLLEKINQRGKLFLSHTKIGGVYSLRMVIGQTYVEQNHIEIALKEILEVAETVIHS